MIGEYLRVREHEVARALRDPEWALEYAYEIEEAEEDDPPLRAGKARRFSTDKAWDLLCFLLTRAQFPVNVVHGEEPFAENEDWGYGPPRYLPADRVGLAARELRRLSYDRLIAGVDPAELTRAEVYPLLWHEPDALSWGRRPFTALQDYFDTAAVHGDAVIVWLD